MRYSSRISRKRSPNFFFKNSRTFPEIPQKDLQKYLKNSPSSSITPPRVNPEISEESPPRNPSGILTIMLRNFPRKLSGKSLVLIQNFLQRFFTIFRQEWLLIFPLVIFFNFFQKFIQKCPQFFIQKFRWQYLLGLLQ